MFKQFIAQTPPKETLPGWEVIIKSFLRQQVIEQRFYCSKSHGMSQMTKLESDTWISIIIICCPNHETFIFHGNTNIFIITRIKSDSS